LGQDLRSSGNYLNAVRPPGQQITSGRSRRTLTLCRQLRRGDARALLYSLVQSCTLIDVSPFDYLKNVLLRAATHPQRLIAQLTPAGWAATFGQRAAA
jgi:hypothetical protein